MLRKTMAVTSYLKVWICHRLKEEIEKKILKNQRTEKKLKQSKTKQKHTHTKTTIQNFSRYFVSSRNTKESDSLFMVHYHLTFAQNSLYWQIWSDKKLPNSCLEKHLIFCCIIRLAVTFNSSACCHRTWITANTTAGKPLPWLFVFHLQFVVK